MKLHYLIDGQSDYLEIPKETRFSTGGDVVLSDKFHDLTQKLPWYEKGYAVIDLFEEDELLRLKRSIAKCLKQIIEAEITEKKIRAFSLEKYHEFVPSSKHDKIVARTRRLYPKDFEFDTSFVIERLSNYLKTKLSMENPLTKATQWIIVRINTPNSLNFNPVHKDIYELYDSHGFIPKMINCWIPVCGVNTKSGLPLAPKSHLINEKHIVRTQAGCIVNSKKFSVNLIKNWGSNKLLKTKLWNGNALVFSSHLIHGFGRNNNSDETRISLEFRLFSN